MSCVLQAKALSAARRRWNRTACNCCGSVSPISAQIVRLSVLTCRQVSFGAASQSALRRAQLHLPMAARVRYPLMIGCR